MVVKEHHTQVAPVVIGWHDEPAVHVGMPARFTDQEPAQVVEMFDGPGAAIEDRRPLHGAGVDDPERLSGRVVVVAPDRLSRPGDHGGTLVTVPGLSPSRPLPDGRWIEVVDLAHAGHQRSEVRATPPAPILVGGR